MKKKLTPLFVSILLFIPGLILHGRTVWLSPVLCTVSYLLIGGKVLLKAAKNIRRGHIFDENFLMCVATLGAFAIREFPEAAAVMLFYQIGERFEHYAVDKSRRSIAELMDIRPDWARLYRDGVEQEVDPEQIEIGDLIRVQPGEKIPLDGVVTAGTAALDTKALTGEPMPRQVQVGDDVISGCINLDGVLTIRVTKPFGESTVSKILDLVENAAGQKAKHETFISRFAAVYTPVVVGAAVLLAVLPPLLIPGQAFSDWIGRALNFLVVSCPCALVISVPLTFFGGIGGASKKGILVKGGNFLEALAKTDSVVLDKTGTLTKGEFAVQEVCPVGMTKEELLHFTASAECFSSHPIAKALLSASPLPVDPSTVTDITETAGFGITATVSGKQVLIGNEKHLQKAGLVVPSAEGIGTIVYVAVGGRFAGHIRIADVIKPEAVDAINRLKKMRVRRTVMLTGDALPAARAVADTVGIDTVYAELLPTDKLEHLEGVLKTAPPGGRVVFVGDGINDAPVLARADIGIAMGGLGADAAIEAADIVIMTDEVSRVATVIGIARKTMRIVRQNIVFAIGIKVAVLILSACGLVGMWAAVFADVGVSVLAILNALRMLK